MSNILEDMGLPRIFGRGRRVRIGEHQSYNVTQLGKQKAENLTLSGPRFKVLAHISEEGPCSISEIVREVGISDDKAKVVLRGLMQDGYVQSLPQD